MTATATDVTLTITAPYTYKWENGIVQRDKRITDFVFIIDGVEYDVTYQQLKHALEGEVGGKK